MGVRPLNRPWCARLHNTYSTLTVPTTRRSSHLDDVIGMIGTLGDRYTLDAEIGAGGMATVHRARDLRHGRQVAIKATRQAQCPFILLVRTRGPNESLQLTSGV